MEISFYHLQHQPLERALPLLIEEWLAKESRIVVQAGSEERLDMLDEALWTYAEASFLAHGRARDGDAGMQPVYLTTGAENPNGARLRFFLDGAEIGDSVGSAQYARIALIFDGNDAAQLERARAEWRRLKDQGFGLIYWRQGGRGWEKRA